MAKFKVNCYYTYCGCVEVEADTIEEAYEKGYDICSNMTTDDLYFCGYTDGTVTDENDEIYEMQ